MYCPKCGAVVSEGSAFCPECGTPMTTQRQTKRYCPKCGTVVPEGSGFCPQCGTQVSQVAGTSPVTYPVRPVSPARPSFHLQAFSFSREDAVRLVSAAVVTISMLPAWGNISGVAGGNANYASGSLALSAPIPIGFLRELLSFVPQLVSVPDDMASTISTLTTSSIIMQVAWACIMVLLVAGMSCLVAHKPYAKALLMTGSIVAIVLAIGFMVVVGNANTFIAAQLAEANVTTTVTVTTSLFPYLAIASAVVGIVVPLVLQRQTI